MNEAVKSEKKKTIILTEAELPLCCPRPEDSLWNAHPRVYLPLEKTGEEVCPYCAQRYRLKKSV